MFESQAAVSPAEFINSSKNESPNFYPLSNGGNRRRFARARINYLTAC